MKKYSFNITSNNISAVITIEALSLGDAKLKVSLMFNPLIHCEYISQDTNINKQFIPF